jgi:hypothetical protein
MNYTALYLPATKEEEYNPTKSGFETPELADKYIKKHLCKRCKDSVFKYLEWKCNDCKPSFDEFFEQKIKDIENYDKKSKEEKDNIFFDIESEFINLYGESWTACEAEWMIIETEKLKDCNNFGDIMEAAGAKRIWGKGEENVNREN